MRVTCRSKLPDRNPSARANVMATQQVMIIRVNRISMKLPSAIFWPDHILEADGLSGAKFHQPIQAAAQKRVSCNCRKLLKFFSNNYVISPRLNIATLTGKTLGCHSSNSLLG